MCINGSFRSFEKVIQTFGQNSFTGNDDAFLFCKIKEYFPFGTCQVCLVAVYEKVMGLLVDFKFMLFTVPTVLPVSSERLYVYRFKRACTRRTSSFVEKGFVT